MKSNGFFAELIEIVKRSVSFDKKLSVYVNGDDNNYPERVERIINNSVTAKSCAHLMKKFIIGKGFTGTTTDGREWNKIIIHPESGLTLYDLLADISLNYAYQSGAILHASGWDLADMKVTALKALPYKVARVGKKDDNDWSGKMAIFENWADQKEVVKAAKDNKITLIDSWNPKKEIIAAQVRKCGKPEDYRGQIYHINPELAIYPLAHIDGSAMNDADSEFRASTFKNISLRKGFFGKMFVVTKPLVGALASEPDQLLSDEDLTRKRHLETARSNFKSTLQSFIGAQNGDGVMHIETDFEGDNIDGVMKFVTVDTNINDKLFAFTEESASKNIRKSFENVPSVLLESSDNSVFGQSGEMIKQAKIFYQEQTADDRRWLAQELRKVLKHFKGLENDSLPEITTLVSVDTKPIES